MVDFCQSNSSAWLDIRTQGDPLIETGCQAIALRLDRDPATARHPGSLGCVCELGFLKYQNLKSRDIDTHKGTGALHPQKQFLLHEKRDQALRGQVGHRCTIPTEAASAT